MMVRVCWLSPLILITILRILQQTTVAGQRSAPDNEIAMATVCAEDLYWCACERGEEEFRPDRSVCWDKSLSLYIKLVPFENNEGGWLAARWSTSAGSRKKNQKNICAHICMNIPMWEIHIGKHHSYAGWHKANSHRWVLQAACPPLQSAIWGMDKCFLIHMLSQLGDSSGKCSRKGSSGRRKIN